METVGELSADQQLTDTSSVSVTPSAASGSSGPGDLMSPAELSPTISRSGAVSVASMIDSNEYRSQMAPESTYHTLNGRMSPGYGGHHHHNPSPTSSYATLTPLQPLPPISTMSSISEKFAASPNVSGSFTLMQNNGMGMPTMDMNSPYARYDTKLSNMGMPMNMGVAGMNTSPMSMMGSNGYSQISSQAHAQPPPHIGSPYQSYAAQNGGLHSPKLEHKMSMANVAPQNYDSYGRGMSQPVSARLHSPNPMMPTSLNGLHHVPNTSPHSVHTPSVMTPTRPGSMPESPNSKQELEEINTKELAQKISSELKRYSIPQAVFAQRVLCRSQGTLSDLLRNPKPWSKLKSGRETFRRMWKWLQEPEFQRMSALRLAGNYLISLEEKEKRPPKQN